MTGIWGNCTPLVMGLLILCRHLALQIRVINALMVLLGYEQQIRFNPFFNISEALEPDWLIAAGAYPGFCSMNMKRLGVFLLPLDGMLVHRRSLPRNLLAFPNNLPVIKNDLDKHFSKKINDSKTK